MKFKFAVVLIIVLMLSVMPGFMATSVEYTEHAEILKDLGLFSGTNLGFELERAPKRVEVAAMLVKFLGAEQEANLKKYSHPFTDVPDWADNLIGYMYEKGLTTGIGNNLFGSNNLAGARDYNVFVLKALGYDMTDFSYADTMKFAVEKGLITANEKSTLESSTFTRDEMVYVSYRSLFTDLKSGAMTLAEKLGKSNIEVVKEPVYTTVYKIAHPENPKNIQLEVDMDTLPAPFNKAVYLTFGGVYWNVETDNAIINYLVPGLKDDNVTSLINNADGYSGNTKNTIAYLYDVDKKLIGYFDIFNTTQVGKFTVEVKEPKPYVINLNVITSGISLNSNAEVVIDRNALPASMKNYSKFVIAPWQPASDVEIEYMAKLWPGGFLYRTGYTEGPVSVFDQENYFDDKIYVYLFDAANNIIGYKGLDSKPAIDYILKSLKSKGIVDVTEGVTYRLLPQFNKVTSYVIPSEFDLKNVYTYGIGTYQVKLNPITIAYYKSLKPSSNLIPRGIEGASTMLGTDKKVYFEMSFYDKEGNLIGYHGVTDNQINARPELFVDVIGEFNAPLENVVLSNQDFNVEVLENGVKVDEINSNDIMIESIFDSNQKMIGVKVLQIFDDPSKNYVYKVVSKKASIQMK